MPTDLKTTVTELPDSCVRVQVEVPPGEVEERLERKARQLGREMKLPGFRRGKVPAPIVIQRLGREAVLEEAVRDTLGSWYADAIERAGIVPVGDPRLDLSDLPAKGASLQFSIEIGVLPTAKLGEYKGLEVGRREAEVDDAAVQQEIERMRDRLARLEGVQRAAAQGDFLVVDYVGSLGGEPFQGGEGRDQLIELGSGQLIDGFEEGLLGASAGETRTLDLKFPEDYGNEQLAGKDASFEVTLKEVKEKQLPEIDDDFAVDLGFDTVAELRDDIRERMLQSEQARAQEEFREAVLDAVVANARVDVPDTLVSAKAVEMWERMVHSLSHRGISRDAYLQISGRDEQQMLEELAPEAEQSLRREAVIAALIEAEKIQPGDEELLQAISPSAEREGVDPAQALERLRQSGRLEEVREEVAARQAVEFVAEHAKPIALQRAQAREKLWTPESGGGQSAEASGKTAEGEQGNAPGGLWTPDR